MSLEWNGPQVTRKAIMAAKWGVDATTAACVREAKTNHPWINRTGTAQGSIQMRPAQERGREVVGIWGSFNVNYFIFLEMGTSRMPAMPSLRPASDHQYPKLAGRIKRKFAELTRI